VLVTLYWLPVREFRGLLPGGGGSVGHTQIPPPQNLKHSLGGIDPPPQYLEGSWRGSWGSPPGGPRPVMSIIHCSTVYCQQHIEQHIETDYQYTVGQYTVQYTVDSICCQNTVSRNTLSIPHTVQYTVLQFNTILITGPDPPPEPQKTVPGGSGTLPCIYK
jgi:hypothetical protein